MDIESLIHILSSASEFKELPVRHNEDKENAELSKILPLKTAQYGFDSPHTKCNLLLQAHFSQAPLPMSDYVTDTKSVLDQCLRVLQAMLDYCADQGWLSASLNIIHLMQMCCQGRWLADSDLTTVPHVEPEHLIRFYDNQPRLDCLPLLIDHCEKNNTQQVLDQLLGDLMDRNQLRDMAQMISHLPQIQVKLSISGKAIPDKRASRATKSKKPKSDDSNEPNMTLEMSTDPDMVYELLETEEYVLNVDLSRLNKSKGGFKGGKAWAPRYPKPKDENWVVMLGNESDLVGLKRLSAIKAHQQMHILFATPEIEDESENSLDLTLYFMSDVYLGLDQQYELKFRLKKK